MILAIELNSTELQSLSSILEHAESSIGLTAMIPGPDNRFDDVLDLIDKLKDLVGTEGKK